MNRPDAPEHVSTILRLHDPARLDRLELALMSLCGQRHPHLSPVIVLQDFCETDELAVRRIAGRLPWRAQSDPPDILNLRGLGPGDHRSKLLNAGLRAATGAYVGFLDFDDWLYPHAYSALIERIRCSGKPVAVGAVAIADMDAASPGGACLRKRPFPHGRSKYDVFASNTYPIHSFLMKRDVAQSVLIPETLCALEDYYVLLSILKDHDWDDALVRQPPIADYVYWADGSNSVAGTSGRGTAGLPWRAAARDIAQLKQDMMIKIPLARLLSMAAAAESDPGQSPPELSAAFLRSIRAFLPFVEFWRRVEGGVHEVAWNGFEAGFSGTVRMPKSRAIPAAGLVFLRRPSRLRPSYRHLSTIGFEVSAEDDGLFTFSGSTALTAQHMRRGRNQLVLFVLTGDGRLYRAPHAGVPSLGSTFRLRDAA